VFKESDLQVAVDERAVLISVKVSADGHVHAARRVTDAETRTGTHCVKHQYTTLPVTTLPDAAEAAM